MRDSIKSKEYFDRFIAEDSARIHDFSEKLESNLINENRVGRIKEKIFLIELGVFIAKYSAGEDLNSLYDSFQSLFDKWTALFSKNNYDSNLKMISLSVLFNSEKKLANLEDLSETDDWLISYILGGDNEKKLAYPEHYETLQKILKEKENETLIDYAKNRWFSEDLECFSAHKSAENTYYGYWCFEIAAIIKKLGIDDSELKNERFYPYDLVHF